MTPRIGMTVWPFRPWFDTTDRSVQATITEITPSGLCHLASDHWLCGGVYRASDEFNNKEGRNAQADEKGPR
jgi:hypothetical protein